MRALRGAQATTCGYQTLHMYTGAYWGLSQKVSVERHEGLLMIHAITSVIKFGQIWSILTSKLCSESEVSSTILSFSGSC